MMKSVLAILKKNKYKVKGVFIAALAAYIFYLVYLTFFDHFYGRTFFHRSVNLIPFKTVGQYINSSNSIGIILTNIVGNIAAFMPIGFLLPLVSKRMKKFSKVMLTVLFATVSIETLQYAFGVGVSDIDDVILNLLGGGVGYFFIRIIFKLCFKIHNSASE